MATELDPLLEALGLKPSGRQSQCLLAYLDLLQRWNATYNLTSVRDRPAMLTHHLADCLAVVGPLEAAEVAGPVLDVGSGGGLPGVVMAVMCPHLDVTCVDAVGKKAAFVRQVAGALQLANLHAVHGRIEALSLPPVRLVTSRAFSSLRDLVTLSRRHLDADGAWMAMKGKTPTEEMADLPPDVQVFHVEQLQVPGLDAQRCLIWMRPQRMPALADAARRSN